MSLGGMPNNGTVGNTILSEANGDKSKHSRYFIAGSVFLKFA